MALFTPGGIVGQISGRVAGSVFSHNRGGTYVRNGTVPHKVISDPAIQAKARMTTTSREWQIESAEDRLAWQNYCQQNPITNRLGHKTTLAAHMAYCGINCRLKACGGNAISKPPNGAAPYPLDTLSGTCSIGAGTCILDWTPDPIPADHGLYMECCVVDRPSLNYIENLYVFIGKLGPANVSGTDIIALIEARFGTLQLGDVIHMRCNMIGMLTGLMSGPMNARITVVA
jgi:hypothetical protein